MRPSNVRVVVDTGTCIGCGTCAALCHSDAIIMEIDGYDGLYKPHVVESLCVECGTCLSVCPKHRIREDSHVFVGIAPSRTTSLIGAFRFCYMGYSSNPVLRHECSSGGIVTQLLVRAIERGLITGALVAKPDSARPLEPRPFIARTSDELLEASGSKYCPVPLNLGLRQIADSGKNERFAVVGLPCHILGIRKAEEADVALKSKIVLHVGLFCGHTPSFKATYALLKRMNVGRDDVVQIAYRGDGWPGTSRIVTKGGLATLPFKECWDIIGNPRFCPDGCLVCSDMFSELTDLSLGDAWISECSNDKEGTSIIVSRSQVGEMLLSDLVSSKLAILDPVSPSIVVRSQMTKVYWKKVGAIPMAKIRSSDAVLDNVLNPARLDYLIVAVLLFGRLLPTRLRNIMDKVLSPFLAFYCQRTLSKHFAAGE